MSVLRPTGRDFVWFTLGLLVAAVAAGLWHRSVQNAVSRQLEPAALRAALLSRPEFLAENPDLVAAARSAMQTRLLESRAAARQQLLATRWKAFLDAAFTPSLGNRSGSTVLLEFTDYLCEPCRASAAAIRRLVGSNPDVRVVVLFLPTQGATSELIARCALAAYTQSPGKFVNFHESLMSAALPFTQEKVMALASESGLDVEQLADDIGRPETRQVLQNMDELARDLEITGAPAFALQGRLLLGGVSAERLQRFVAAQIPRPSP